ncbi:MAG: hypothetical protein D6731_00220 [Planctomycetota bacterium]|nr:MAG: hypothetical protein D6731_00220 [Planctomycetota bacterium]
MISKRDVELGKIALKQGMVDKEQLTKCLALKKKLAKKGKKVQLGSLLIRKGYIDEEQLETIVRLHNERLAKRSARQRAAADDEAGGRRSRRSKRSKRSKRAGDGGEETPRKGRKRKKKARPLADEADEDEGQAAVETATATREAKAKSKKGKARDAAGRRRSARTSARAKTSREARAKKSASKRRASAREDAAASASALESAVEGADPALFQSARESDVETTRRRLIGCPECGKKYRVRPNQVGKRFHCRRCNYRIKVPRDLFERPIERPNAVEVEEFVLSSSDQVDPEEAEEAVRAAAVASKAVERIGKKASIRELAQAAEKWQAKPVGPQRRFGLKGLLTMAASFGTLAAIVGGGAYAYQAKQERLAREKQARIDAEFDAWKEKLDAALAKATAAEERKDPDLLGGVLGDVVVALEAKDGLLRGNNRQRAEQLIAAQGVEQRLRDLHLARGRLILARGGLRAAEALRDFEEAVRFDPGDEGAQCALGRVRVLARRFADAARGLEGAAKASQRARALRGLALELGGAGAKAAEVYASLEAPEGAVLAGRAYLVDGEWGRAQDAVRKSGLQGPAVAAAKIVEALALEGKNEFRQALALLDRAVLEAKELPFAYLARAAFRLRHGGDPEQALQDAKAGNRQGATAWGLLLQGDAQLALLRWQDALSSYREAAQARRGAEEGLRVEGEVDPFAPPVAPDFRVVARARLALAHVLSGEAEAARVELSKGIQANPFSPYGQAALAHLDLLGEQGKLSPESEFLFQQALEKSRRLDAPEGELVPSVSSAYLLLVKGALLVTRTRYGEAVESLRRAADLDPNLAAAARALEGQAHRRSSRATDSREAFRAAARHDERSRSYRMAARLLASPKVPSERLEGAVRCLLLQNPYSAHARVLEARVLLRRERPKEALAALDKAIARNPELGLPYTRRALFFLLELPESMRDVDQAGRDLDQALAVESRAGGVRPLTYWARAVYHQERGEIPQAIAILDRCLKEHEDYAEAFKLRAKLHSQAGDKVKAQADWKRYKDLTAR